MIPKKSVGKLILIQPTATTPQGPRPTDPTPSAQRKTVHKWLGNQYTPQRIYAGFMEREKTPWQLHKEWDMPERAVLTQLRSQIRVELAKAAAGRRAA